MPFKLTLGYVGLIPLIALWLVENRSCIQEKLAEEKLLYPLYAFIVIALFTSLFGINPLRSFRHVGTLLFFPFAVFAFRDSLRLCPELLYHSLFIGAACAGLSALLEYCFPWYQVRFLGPVSLSGQYTLIIPLALGYAFTLIRQFPHESLSRWKVAGIGIGGLSVFVGFSGRIPSPVVLEYIAGALLLSIVAFALYRHWRSNKSAFLVLLITVLVPLLSAALLVNLKRGPWLGLAVGLTIFFWIFSRKALLFALLLGALSFLLLEPVQARVSASMAHFFITGGRSSIWDIGLELLSKYPLGIGFENSGFLRMFSKEIPSELKHFHNNFLNIAVELGWLGLCAYVATLFSLLKAALPRWRNSTSPTPYPLLIASCCGILSWQVAGLVEYNFGDASVVAIAYFTIAVLLTTRPVPGSLHQPDISLDTSANSSNLVRNP